MAGGRPIKRLHNTQLAECLYVCAHRRRKEGYISEQDAAPAAWVPIMQRLSGPFFFSLSLAGVGRREKIKKGGKNRRNLKRRENN